jgi:hypothetical protein
MTPNAISMQAAVCSKRGADVHASQRQRRSPRATNSGPRAGPAPVASTALCRRKMNAGTMNARMTHVVAPAQMLAFAQYWRSYTARGGAPKRKIPL